MQDRVRSDSSSPLRGRASPLRAPMGDRGLRILGELARGTVFGGAAFLLGSCPQLFLWCFLASALLLRETCKCQAWCRHLKKLAQTGDI